ncbi:MAG: hypothetical protein L3J84_14410 [Gammaproteobacteria bacterium]|nr:hypothetical protein [Gammaproteobacteria bacterium]
MKINSGDIAKYPKFHSYVKNDIPKLVRVNQIVNTIRKFSGSTALATIKQGLIWDSNPIIEIVPTLRCGGVRAYGCYPIWGDNKIQIDRALVRAYEAGTDKRPTTAGLLVHVTGVTLLHELTHWADAKDGVDNSVPGDPSNEEGNAFELEIYGKIITL